MNCPPSHHNASAPSGADILDQVSDFICQHVKVTDDAVPLITLWIAWTWLSPTTYFQPRLAIISPEPRCGKSTLLRLLQLLTRNPLSFSNITAPALFRMIADRRPTILIDEADSFLNLREEATNIINAGFERTGTVVRCAPKTLEIQEFPVASPLAIAAIGIETLAPSVLDRSILVEMQRKGVGEKLQSLRVDKPGSSDAIRDLLECWGRSIEPRYAQHEPDMPDLSSDRAADKLRPLIAIADLAGGHWPELARHAAVSLVARMSQGDSDTSGVRLLRDIRDVFDRLQVPRIKTTNLLAELNGMEEAPWCESGRNGHPMSPHQLSQKLRRFGISPAPLRIGGPTARGYHLYDFEAAFSRYLTAEQT